MNRPIYPRRLAAGIISPTYLKGLGMQIKATVPQLAFIYAEAHAAVERAGERCPQCWRHELALKAFGARHEVYTLPDGGGLWVFDVDAARAIVGDRIDGEIPPDILIETLGESEPGHEACLIRRALAGHKTTGAAGVICQTPMGMTLIDGTHRGRLCIGAGVPLPVAVLTDDEAERVILTRPPNDATALQTLEMWRMAPMFAKMDADAFFGMVAEVIGKPRLRELLGDQS